MAIFKYQGRNAAGELLSGQLNASSLDAIIDALKQQGITPIDIQLSKGSDEPFAFLKKKLWIAKVTSNDLIAFCRQMYALLKAGVPLIKTLTLIKETIKSDALIISLDGIITDVTSGQTLMNAVRKHPKVFSPLFVSLIDAGENSGQLDSVFLQLSEYLELMERTTKQIKTATRYPTLVVTAIGGAMIVVNFFVIPNFASVFEKFHINLPWPTRVLLGSSNFLIHSWVYLLLIFSTLFTSVYFYLRTPKGHYVWDEWKLKIPIFGSIIQRIILGRFTRSFAMILRTGVPLTQGIELVSNILDNEYMRRHILMMKDGVEKGETLTNTAKQTHLFSPMILQMFSTGEESGNVDDLLQEAAEFYEREVEYDLKHLSDLIEPLLLVILGVMVLILALGIFLPMWDMVKFVQQ
jgi:MSHA biogenesis protein MshG